MPLPQAQEAIDRHQTVHWITDPQAPAACPLCPSLDCEIPVIRHQILQVSVGCTTPDGTKCAGHEDPYFAEQATKEMDWRMAN